MILWGGNCLPVPYFVQMGLLVLHGYVGGVIYYGDTLRIVDMGSCLMLLGPTCLWRGLDSPLCSYRTQALHGDSCLWRCRMNWSRLASQGEDVFFVWRFVQQRLNRCSLCNRAPVQRLNNLESWLHFSAIHEETSF